MKITKRRGLIRVPSFMPIASCDNQSADHEQKRALGDSCKNLATIRQIAESVELFNLLRCGEQCRGGSGVVSDAAAAFDCI